MKILLTTLIASIGFIGAAFAAEMEGAVQSVDAAGMKLMLENGSEFAVNDGVSLEGIQPGSMVKIVVDDATNTITEISPK